MNRSRIYREDHDNSQKLDFPNSVGSVGGGWRQGLRKRGAPICKGNGGPLAPIHRHLQMFRMTFALILPTQQWEHETSHSRSDRKDERRHHGLAYP